jgi:hypothetical protein
VKDTDSELDFEILRSLGIGCTHYLCNIWLTSLYQGKE